MKHKWHVLLLTCAGASLAFAHPASAQSVAGEKWKISTSMQMSGMSMPGRSSEVCKQPGDDSVPIQTEKNCQVYDIARNGNVQTFKMRCTGKDAMEGSAELTYLGPDHYKGKMQVNTQGETMTMAYEGQKLGPCDGGEMNLQAKKMVAQGQQQLAEQEKMMAEQCHKQAAEAASPQVMLTLCKDPEDHKVYCSAVKTYDKFQAFAVSEQQAVANGAGNQQGMRPLTESAQLCGFSVDAERARLCSSAEANGKLDFIVSQCPVQGQALAAQHCAGRSYTTMSTQYRSFCSSFASRQPEDASAEDTGTASKTKGLLNKGKKALGGLFSN
jgi:hypothetical protein